MKKILVLFSMVILTIATTLPNAHSTIFTPSLSDIASSQVIDGPPATIVPDTDDVYFFSLLNNSTYPYLEVGTIFDNPVDMSSYDAFGVHVFNQNEYEWQFSLFAFDGSTRAYSDPLVLNAGYGADIIWNWTQSLNLQNVKEMGLRVEFIQNRNFDTAEFRVSPVPEPSSLTLLLFGLPCLAFARRKKRR